MTIVKHAFLCLEGEFWEKRVANISDVSRRDFRLESRGRETIYLKSPIMYFM